MGLCHESAGFHTLTFVMKVKLTFMKACTTYIIALLFLPMTLLLSQQNFQLVSAEMSIEGTSTLHDWVSSVNQFSAKAKMEISDNKLLAIPLLEVLIPAKGIKSTKGKIMDGKTFKALKAEDHPNIQFKLKSISLKGTNTLIAAGQLKIAGESKAVKFPVKYTIHSKGEIQFNGAYTLKMTEYKMDPPTALMGSIKTGDEVTVRFECVLGPSGQSSNAK